MKAQNLDVFKLGHDLATEIYKTTAIYPGSERFGLVPQMTRAASSRCMNLMDVHRTIKNEYEYFISGGTTDTVYGHGSRL